MTAADHQEQAGDASRRHLVNQVVGNLRNRLLDLTTRNPLLAFKHGAKSPRFIRVVDEIPNFLFDRLERNESDVAWKFRSLGEPDEELEDEKTTVFRRAMDAARLEDADYLEQLDALGDDPGEKQVAKAEEELRNRVRERLGLPDKSSRQPKDISEVAKRRGIDASYDLPGSTTGEARHADSFVQTLLYEGKMQSILSAIREKVAIATSEMGVNPLFSVFGFLEWYESDASDSPLHAPLLLYPLTLTRDLVRGAFQYGVKSSGEGAQMNVALAARLKKDFGLELPDVDDETTPDGYMASVQACIQGRKGWRVRRWVTIGLFSFARIAMYADLAAERWGQGGFINSTVIRRLLTGEADNSTLCGSSEQEEVASESEVDTPTIYDADSTQEAALRDALQGRNLVIEGPPGTGKSQTIANIIAASLANGKSVLFLAEKMAALRVVKSRLDAAGLGEFCLELHSTKVGRKEVIKQIAARLEKKKVHGPVYDSRTVAAELDSIRNQLGALASALSKPAASLGITVHSLIWKAASLRRATESAPSEIDDIETSAALDLTTADIDSLAASADSLQSLSRAIREQYGSINEHPWKGVASAGMGIMQCQDTVRTMWKVSRAARQAVEAARTIRTKTNQDIQYLGELRRICAATTLEAPAQHLDQDCLAQMAPPNATQLVRGLLEELRQFDEYTSSLAQVTAWPKEEPLPITLLRQLAETVGLVTGLDSAKHSDLDQIASAERHRSSQLDHCIQLVESVRGAVGMQLAHTPAHVLRDTIVAASEAVASGECVLTHRCEALNDPDALSLLRRLKERQKKIAVARNALAASFRWDKQLEPDSLRNHARRLRQGGLFARFHADWRRAHRAFQTLHVGVAKMRPIEMAQAMEHLADHLDTTRELDSDPDLRRLAGPNFSAWDMELEPLEKTAEWMTRCRMHLPPSLAEHLAFGPIEKVRAIARLASHPGMEELGSASFQDVAEVKAALETSRVRHDRIETARALLARCRLNASVSLDSLPRILKLAERTEHLKASLSTHQAARDLLGPLFQGVRTSQSALQDHLAWVTSLQAIDLPRSINSWLLSGHVAERCHLLRSLAEDISQSHTDTQLAIAALCQLANVRFRQWLGAESLDDVILSDLADVAQKCANASDELGQLVEYEDLHGRLSAFGLGDIPNIGDARDLNTPFGTLCKRVLLQNIVRHVVAREPALAGFSGTTHDGKRDKFRALDRKLMELRRSLIAASLMERPIEQGRSSGLRSEWTGLSLIRNEVAKQQRFISVRDLMRRSGEAVQDLMPCFMMSPISVAQYLPAGGLSFDLLVMDEASQLRPEDALGAIVRAKQVVIVGDPKQLPPTAFFLGSGREDTAYAEDMDLEVAESILDTALSTMGRSRLLRWHYRSRHESLISFSNREFYDGKLVLFPSPYGGDRFGVRYHRVADGCYSGGVNPPEARQVAALVLECSRLQPDRTLGVVALNQRQSELIGMEVDKLAIDHPEFEAWRRNMDKGLEPFFVKNLENVQGDERDTVIISTVYGRDVDGNMYQRLGPINTQGGHRRLNVLFTRAKFNIVLVTSMGPEDIVVAEKSSLGVRALKRYLSFARDGFVNTSEEAGGEEESAFEKEVAEFLRAQGYDVACQVGVAGYRIDLAVRKPGTQSGYALGIECDGSAYHSSRSARDRDRLRQEHLERLNWRIHRIWSLDWFSRPKREADKLLDRVRKAVAE